MSGWPAPRAVRPGGPWDDQELRELLSLCLVLASQEAAQQDGEARAFYEETAAVLAGIQAEVSAGPA